MMNIWGVDPGVHEAANLCLDASKSRAELGWQLQLNIESALNWTVNWYRTWQRGDTMRDFTWNHIEAYETLLTPC